MRKALSIAIFTIAFLVGGAKAQIDPHFSQYYAYPLWLNPALTGIIDSDVRINAIYRNQWAGIANGFETGAVSIDFRPTEKISFGINILDQAAGSAGFNYLNVSGSFSYRVALNKNKWINFGLQAGAINRSFDVNKLELGSQYNPVTGFDPGMPSNENFYSSNATVFDAASGAFFYDQDPSSTVNYFAGVALSHLSRPKDVFAGNVADTKMPLRYTLHGGLRIKASDVFHFLPHVVYIRQQKNAITAFGVYTEIRSQTNSNAFMLGFLYRVNDASAVNAGYRLGKFTIGTSYDFNTSSLKAALRGKGGPEISLSYTFGKKLKEDVLLTPRF